MTLRFDYSLPCNAANYTRGRKSKITHIVIHYTGADGTAKNNATYFHNNNVGASAHYFIDGTGVVWVSVDPEHTAWAVGAWKGATQLISNAQSVSIEVCNNGGRFSDAEIAELCELVPALMAEYSIPAENVVRHWDCHTGRKECPAYYAGANNAAWKELHAKITEGDTMSWSEPIKGWNGEVAACDRLAGADKAANDARSNSAAILKSLTTDTSGRTDGKMPLQTRVSYLAEKLDRVDADIKTLTALVESMTDALAIAIER